MPGPGVTSGRSEALPLHIRADRGTWAQALPHRTSDGRKGHAAGPGDPAMHGWHRGRWSWELQASRVTLMPAAGW